MDFLKELFGTEALTYDQLSEKVTEKKLNVVDISGGQYVSRAKFDDRTKVLEQQVKDLQGQITQRDADIADLNTKLVAAQGDAGKLTDVQKSLTDLQAKYDADKTAWADAQAKQAYEFDIRERASTLTFSSASAKKAFIAEAIGKDFKRDGDTLLGYEDFVTKYKEADPGAFVEEKPDEPNPNPAPIVLPSGGQPKPGARMTLSEAMQKANNDPNFKPNFD